MYVLDMLTKIRPFLRKTVLKVPVCLQNDYDENDGLGQMVGAYSGILI